MRTADVFTRPVPVEWEGTRADGQARNGETWSFNPSQVIRMLFDMGFVALTVTYGGRVVGGIETDVTGGRRKWTA